MLPPGHAEAAYEAQPAGGEDVQKGPYVEADRGHDEEHQQGKRLEASARGVLGKCLVRSVAQCILCNCRSGSTAIVRLK